MLIVVETVISVIAKLPRATPLLILFLVLH